MSDLLLENQETFPTALVLTQFCGFDVGSDVLKKCFGVRCVSCVSGLRFQFSYHKPGLQVKFGPSMRNSEGDPHALSLFSFPSENRQHPPKISLRSGKPLWLLLGYHMGKKFCLLLLQDKLKLLISIAEVLVLRKFAFL